MVRVGLAVLLGLTACGTNEDPCVTWTKTADACMEQAGMDPIYVNGVTCTDDPALDAMYQCMQDAWDAADCTTTDGVNAAAAASNDCIPQN